MDEFNLQPGEFIIKQTDQAAFPTGSTDMELGRVVLTNRNLILVADKPTGIFSSKKLVKRCPLEQVHDMYGIPQAIVTKNGNNWIVQIAFYDDTVSLQFEQIARRQAQSWADAVKNAATGNLDCIEADDLVPDGVADFVEGAKGIVGAFGTAFGGAFGTQSSTAKQAAAATRPAMADARCRGCHAPLSGRIGTTITCPYCDTKQTL